MTAREQIRIGDLAEPQLSPFQQQIVDATRDRAVPLDAGTARSSTI